MCGFLREELTFMHQAENSHTHTHAQTGHHTQLPEHTQPYNQINTPSNKHQHQHWSSILSQFGRKDDTYTHIDSSQLQGDISVKVTRTSQLFKKNIL